MKKLLVAVAALAMSTSAFAQTGGAGGANGGQLGIGVAITPVDSFRGIPNTVEIYVPFKIAPTLRLEPSVGIYTVDSDAGNDTTDLTLGAGLFVTQKVAAPVDVYFGGRVKLNFAGIDTGATDDSGTDFFVAGAAGGEYYLAPKFSIGLEANLGFYSLSEVSGDESGFYTTGLGFLRVYL